MACKKERWRKSSQPPVRSPSLYAVTNRLSQDSVPWTTELESDLAVNPENLKYLLWEQRSQYDRTISWNVRETGRKQRAREWEWGRGRESGSLAASYIFGWSVFPVSVTAWWRRENPSRRLTINERVLIKTHLMYAHTECLLKQTRWSPCSRFHLVVFLSRKLSWFLVRLLRAVWCSDCNWKWKVNSLLVWKLPLKAPALSQYR